MNRPFKFRVWDIKDKCWDNPAHVEVWDSSGILKHMYGEENYVIQQYTGLQDNNKKDIYEGDIVIYTINKKTYMSVIMWKNFGWVTQDYPEGLSFPLTTETEYTIIGNIFENSHVLK